MADLVTNNEVNSFLGTSGVDYSAAIGRASQQVETFIRRPVIYKAITEYHDGGFQSIILRYYPVKSESVTVTHRVNGTTVAPADYYVDEQLGQLIHNSVWDRGVRIWKVDYTAGLVAPDEQGGPGNVPADIKKAVLLLIKAERSGGSTAVVKSKKIGSWQEQYDTAKGGTVADEVAILLDPYRRWRF